jgi:hypothetical protein
MLMYLEVPWKGYHYKGSFSHGSRVRTRYLACTYVYCTYEYIKRKTLGYLGKQILVREFKKMFSTHYGNNYLCTYTKLGVVDTVCVSLCNNF